MAKLVFATRNRGKLVELQHLLSDVSGLTVLSLDDVDVPDVIEDGDTFEANAIKKAREVSAHLSLPALADDSGLEVDALGGAPGVYSARYAGEPCDDGRNNDKLVEALKDVADGERSGRFRSVLAFADVTGKLGERTETRAGACEGVVLREPRGDKGFGYDPLFYVPELGQTFAELGSGTKNNLSHRARAMAAMKPVLVAYFQLASTESSG